MYKVISVDGNQLIYDYGDGIQHRGDTEIKWRIYHNMLSEKNPSQTTHPSQRLRSLDDEDFFTYPEVSPIIGDIVEAYGKNHDDYMTHEKIVAELMKHPEGQLILSRPHDRSNRYWAGVMVACFSKKFTGGSSEWNKRFDEPKKIGSAWAYRVLGKER